LVIVSDHAFYSDRSGQPVPRVSEEVSENAWREVIALIRQRIADGSLAHDFPLRNCPDGDFVTGTAEQWFTDSLQAHVPDLDEGFLNSRAEAPPTPVALDVIDFVARHIENPTRREPHHYFGHEHVFFGRGKNDLLTAGPTPSQQRLRQDVDLVFARNGIAFTLGTNLRISRLGPPEARKLISDFRPATGDARLMTSSTMQQPVSCLATYPTGRSLWRSSGTPSSG
jgi:hypothetical protein